MVKKKTEAERIKEINQAEREGKLSGNALFEAKKKASQISEGRTITPEERQGTIRQRERTLGAAGVDVGTPDVQKRAILQQAGGGGATGQLPSNVLATTKSLLQEAGALDAVTTTGARELNPPTDVLGADLPVIGKSAAVLSGTSPEVKKQIEEQIKGNLAVATARDKVLADIRVKEFNKELSTSEEFGATIEAIPVVGGLVGKYVGGLVEAPFSNVKTIQAQINSERERAVNLIEKTRIGAIAPEDSLMTLQTMQDNMAKLEGRVQRLITTSAVLRANADEVNKLEEDIWRANQVVEFSRQAIGVDMGRKISGVGTPVPQEQTFFGEISQSKDL